MDGEETLRHIRQIRPGVAVVLTSGYSEDDAVRRFQDQRTSRFPSEAIHRRHPGREK